MERYRVSIIIRIISILLLGFIAMYIAMKTYFWMTSVWVGAIVVILTFELIKYVEKSRIQLKHFLDSIKQNDFSLSFSESNPGAKEKSNQDIKYALNEVMNVLRRLRREQAENYAYLQTIVEHVKVALICFDKDYSIKLINNEAKELFQTEHIYSVQNLKRIDHKLYETILSQTSGDKRIVKAIIDNKLLNLSVRTSEFIMGNERFKLLSFQDIKSELDTQEIESWQKIIRVITHEIRNSAIPISTLSNNLSHRFVDLDGQPEISFKDFSVEDIDDLRLGLETISKRSKGLVKFVESTSKFTQPLKNIEFQEISVNDLFIKVITLLQAKTNENMISVSYSIIPPQKDIMIKADGNLIEQTMINLMLNSIDALKEQDHPSIELSAIQNPNGKTEIKVTDNGKGISDDIKDKIFIPFYSTKDKGNGIGLSLSRQVMHIHKGSIHFKSEPFKETSFCLVF